MADKFRTEITADRTQYDAVMAGAVGKAMETGQAIAGAFSRFQSTLIGVGAAIAGAGVFGKAADQSKELVVESEKLARALGVSASEASVLAVALNDIHQSADVMLSANRAMTRTLGENEEAFKSLGVETRDQNGEFRNSLDIMLDVNKRLLTFREGIDRNIEGQKIYKKAWEEVAPVLKLTTDLMDESKKKAEALGLVVGKERIEAVTRYRAAMNDVGDVMKAVGVAIGDVVMPVLTEMGNAFAETGPAIKDFARGAMAVLIAAFYSLSTAVQAVWEFIKAFVQTGVVALLKFAEVGSKAIRFDFSGAKEAWQRGTDQQEAIWRQAGERVKAIAEENGRKTADAFERGFGKPVVTATQRTAGTASAGGEDKGRVQRWESELAEARDGYDRLMLEQGSFEQFSKESERDYWKDILDTEKLSKEERIAVSKKYYDLEREIRKNFIKEQKALGVLSIEEERASQLQLVEFERDNLETLEKLGQISGKQKLERLRDLKNIEYAIELQALQAKLELLKNDPTNPVGYQEQLNKIAELKRKHQLDMAKIDNQMVVESVKIWNEIGDAITGAFSTAIKGVIMGTQDLQDAVRKLGQSIVLSLLDMGIKTVANWIKAELIKTATTQTGTQARVALEAGAAAQTIAIKAVEATAVVGDNAAEAASGAAAAVADVPYVGPALAAAAFAAIMAMVLGAQSQITSAAGGFNIPTGVNPITQLHQEEMVLPADIANPLRDSLGTGGGGVGERPIHVHISAVDGQSVERLLINNKVALARAIRAAARGLHTPSGR